MSSVVVVGAGVMGAATARALAGRGHDVTLLERFEIGHTHGSSHGSSRIFRFSYPDATFVRMAQEALPLWNALESETGSTLLIQTGGLDLGPNIDANVTALRTCGAKAKMLTSAEVSRRWPHLALPDGAPIMYTPDSGVVLADQAWAAFARSAIARGVALEEKRKVEKVTQDPDGVSIMTDAGVMHVDVCVVTAGSWVRSLLEPAGIEVAVRPTRETLAYFRLPESRPPVVVDWSEPAIYSQSAPGQGLKVGEHSAGPDADPDTAGSPDAASLARLKAWVTARFPTAEPEPHHTETCLYTNTSDQSFILEKHDRIVVGSPCSGHGFKFAPLIGERLADLVDLVD